MDYYKVLGVPESSTQDDIKKAYRKLSLKHHPDRGGDAEQFKKINEAYKSLHRFNFEKNCRKYLRTVKKYLIEK